MSLGLNELMPLRPLTTDFNEIWIQISFLSSEGNILANTHEINDENVS